MSCAYSLPNCPEKRLLANAESCPECQGFLKSCPGCGIHNRAFANFCRSCQASLSTGRGNWLSYKGGSRRLGLNNSQPSGGEPLHWENLEIRETSLKLQLGDSCRSLLGYDRHIIAISQNGTIEVGDPLRATADHRMKADGPVSCEPCIERGILYLGSPGRLTAYSLGGLGLAKPRLTPLWQLPLTGTPIQALAALDDRLYLTVFHPEGRKEVQVVEDLKRTPPRAGRVLHASARLSWVAADPVSKQVVFFSQEGKETHLHTVSQAGKPEMTSRPVLLPPFAEQLPIALLGGKVFGVFGEDEKLCRVDVRTASFEQGLDTDTKLFSLSQEGEQDWDGDGVRVQTTGVAFLRSGVTDSFTPLDRVAKGSPIILQGSSAVLAMQDGRIRVYDLLRPPRHEVRRLTDDGEPITALASFQNFVAAGNAKGIVKVLELCGKRAAS